MPSMAGMLSSIGPTAFCTGFAPRSTARLKACAASFTRNAMAQARRPVLLREALAETARLGVDDEVDVALLVQRDVLAAMARRDRESHALEQRTQQFGVGRGVFDEFETVGTHRIFEEVGHGSPPAS